MILGKATSSATQENLKRHHIEPQSLGDTGLFCSSIGFGSYRITTGVESYEAALKQAIQNGVNLIDTSANYMNGDAERLIGHVLKSLVTDDFSRESVIVVTKAGYVQGDALTESRDRKARNQGFKDLMELDEGLSHCIHPDYLSYQLDGSLKRLGLESIDVFLLHNPEYFFEWAKTQDFSKGEAQALFYDRIRLAFEFCEAQVELGKIQFYGISSNSFPFESDDLQFIELERLLDIANSISKNHHFKIIQCPFNLVEPDAAILKNQNQNTVLEWATQNKMGVLVNRPLNGYKNGRLKRLTELGHISSFSKQEIEVQLYRAAELEIQFIQSIMPQFEWQETENSHFQTLLSSAQELLPYWAQFSGFYHWQDIVNHLILPREEQVLNILGPILKKFPELEEWSKHYCDILNGAVRSISSYYKARTKPEIDYMKDLLADLGLPDRPLSQLAVGALMATPGVSSVLVGMRDLAYVEDMMSLFEKPIPDALSTDFWTKLSTHQLA